MSLALHRAVWRLRTRPCPSFRAFLAWDMAGVVLAPSVRLRAICQVQAACMPDANARHPRYLQSSGSYSLIYLVWFSNQISVKRCIISYMHADWKQDKKSIDLRQRESIRVSIKTCFSWLPSSHSIRLSKPLVVNLFVHLFLQRVSYFSSWDDGERLPKKCSASGTHKQVRHSSYRDHFGKMIRNSSHLSCVVSRCMSRYKSPPFALSFRNNALSFRNNSKVHLITPESSQHSFTKKKIHLGAERLDSLILEELKST